MDSLLRASGIGVKQVLSILEEDFSIYSESGLWTACQSILTEVGERQDALGSQDANQVISILEESINTKKIQMDFIQSMLDNEE